MSKLYQMAETIKTHLESFIPADELIIVVDRQKDLESEVNKHLAKTKGGVAVIEWGGIPKIDPKYPVIRGDNAYIISLICTPILRNRAGQLPADELLEKITSHLQHWEPSTSKPKAIRERMEVKSIKPIKHPTLLIYSITAEIEIQFEK